MAIGSWEICSQVRRITRYPASVSAASRRRSRPRAARRSWYAPVHLDDQSLLRPEAVDLEVFDHDVRPGPRQPGHVGDLEQPRLGSGADEGGGVVAAEQLAEYPGPAGPAVSRDDVR